jgi:hypothetical protein
MADDPRVCEADDNELVLIDAFDLTPDAAIAGLLRCVKPLGFSDYRSRP